MADAKYVKTESGYKSADSVEGMKNKVNGDGINNIVKKTQAEYDAMSYHDPNTLYVIVG